MAVSFPQNWADDVVEEFDDTKELLDRELLMSLLDESQAEEDCDDDERLLAVMKSLQAEIDSAAAAPDHELVSAGVWIGGDQNCATITMSPENIDFTWMDMYVEMDMDDTRNWYMEENNGTNRDYYSGLTMACVQDQQHCVSLWQEY